MKKKWIGVFAAAMLIASQVMCVSASRVTSPSASSDTTTPASTTGTADMTDVEVTSGTADYVASTMGTMNESGVVASDTMPEETKAEYQTLAAEQPGTVSNIREFNTSRISIQEFLAREAPGLADVAAGRTAITPIFDVSPINGGRPDGQGNHNVRISLPSLTTAMRNLHALHYDMAARAWEEIGISNIDYTNKMLTLNFGNSLSPVVIVAEVTGDSAVGTSPKTGVTTDWVLWLAAAAVLGGVSADSFRKAKMTRK